MTSVEPEPTARLLRVIVADDDSFTTSLVGDGLRSQGFIVFSASTAEDALSLVDEVDAHALVTDLNFGPGMSGAELLRRVRETSPWVALVVLTSHQSPELAVENPADVPDDAVYLVKSQVARVDQLASAVTRAIGGLGTERAPNAPAILVTTSQAEVLRKLAIGESTKSIAEARGTTVRAAEAMISRLYEGLGLYETAVSNPRIAAIQLWQQGRIRVR
jgi:DNA-binding NarL/FixJ family response regulator